MTNCISGCIASVVRLHTLVTIGSTSDPTWYYVPIIVWTEIELACGHICVSLPAVRVLIDHILHKDSRSQEIQEITTSKKSTPSPIFKTITTQVESKRLTIWPHHPAAASRGNPGSLVTAAWPGSWSPHPWSGAHSTSTAAHRKSGSDHGSVRDFSHVRT